MSSYSFTFNRGIREEDSSALSTFGASFISVHTHGHLPSLTTDSFQSSQVGQFGGCTGLWLTLPSLSTA